MKKDKDIDLYNWDYITIEKYCEIVEICNSDDEDLIKDARVIALIEGKPEDEIFDLPFADLSKKRNKLVFLNKFDFDKLKLSTKKINISGKEFEFTDINKLNVSQYVDYQNFIKQDLSTSLERIISVFLVPKGYKYNTDYDIVELQNWLRKNLSFKLAQSILNFILIKYIKSLCDSLIYLIKATPKKDREALLMKLEKAAKDSLSNLISAGSAS